MSMHHRRLLLTLCLLAGTAAQGAGPRDNPLLEPKLPDLPDLYGNEAQDKTAPQPDEEFTPPRAPTVHRPATLRELASGSRLASPEMRAELQRQIAEYHNLTGNPDTALTTLLAARARDWLSFDNDKIALDAARLYHRLDLPIEAERLYAGLPEWQVPQDERQRFLIDRAQSHYDRGDNRKAAQMLEALGTPADLAIANRAESLRIRILMAQGRFSEINRLFEEQLGRPRNNLYTRYNLGVSMVAGGQTGEGIGQLDELGSIPAVDPEPLALRDQANLSLGWAFLQAGQGATARPFLRRVRLDSAASGKALLGLGWALLAPDGEPQQKTITRLQNCLEDPAQILQSTTAVMRRPARESCGKPKVFRYRRDLEFEAGEENAHKRLRGALAAWERLMNRPASDPSVQEALLARGYGLEQLQLPREAASAYRLAIQKLEKEQQNLQSIRQALLQKPLTLLDMNASEQAYLSELISSPQFQETRLSMKALQGYGQRLRALDGRLNKLTGGEKVRHEAIRQRLTRMQARHRSLLASYEDVLLRLAERQFEARSTQLNTYLKRARLSLAQLHGQGS